VTIATVGNGIFGKIQIDHENQHQRNLDKTMIIDFHMGLAPLQNW